MHIWVFLTNILQPLLHEPCGCPEDVKLSSNKLRVVPVLVNRLISLLCWIEYKLEFIMGSPHPPEAIL